MATMLTMGVAIAIPDPYGPMLREKRAGFGDQLARSVPSHVTLMPPLELADGDLHAVCTTLSDVATTLQPFPLTLRGTDTFRPVSPVVFVAIADGMAGIEGIASAVRTRLEAPAAEFPFHPHVTVAHNIDDAALDQAAAELSDFECSFRVDSFHLYLHQHDEGWTPTHEFRLAAPV